jgi:hypothetical protein
MSQHPPQHLHRPTAKPTADPGTEHVLPDVVAGDPPVPITVWRTARTSADAGQPITARLATRLVAAYSRPGDAVLDITAGHALTAACTVGRRRHHPACFTDTSSVIIGPAATGTGTGTTWDDDREAADGGPELRAWFGNDLTDPDPPPPTGRAPEPPPGSSVQDASSLVVAGWPLHPEDAANRVRLAWLLTASARLLRPGGCLILVVAVSAAGAGSTPQDFSPVVAAAASVGLSYLQHIVAVTADTDGDAFTYHATDEELLALAATRQQPGVPHLCIHTDLLVFSLLPRPATPSGGRRRACGGRG